MMLDIHFDFIAGVLQKEGYDIEVLQNESQEVIEEGLKNVHNDMCYPALLVIGQFIHALKSGRYNVNRIALLLTQTGGGCRASNYIYLLRKALDRNKFTQVKVLSLNFAGLDKENEFSLSFRAGFRLFQSILYGDLLMLLYNQSVAFEKNMGESKKILARWKKKLIEEIGKKTFSQLKENYRNILEDFASIPKNKENRKIKVGIVGEIYMKYSPLGNNHLTEYLEQEKAEVVNTGILDFLLFNLYDTIFDKEIYGKGGFRYMLAKMLAAYVQRKQGEMIACIKKMGIFVHLPLFQKCWKWPKAI